MNTDSLFPIPQPEELIDCERQYPYGANVDVSKLTWALLKAIPTATAEQVAEMTSSLQWTLDFDGKDAILLKACIDNEKGDIARHLVEKCGARHNVNVQV